MKLPITIGILTWKSKLLPEILTSYKVKGLIGLVEEVHIFFQEGTEQDRQFAESYGMVFEKSDINVGIGKAFEILASKAKTKFFLPLEHDWLLVEPGEVTKLRLEDAIELLREDVDVVRLRHRKQYGDPLYTCQFKGKEECDMEHGLAFVHLLDCVHWRQHPHVDFPSFISKRNGYFKSTSRYANFTNNPCLWKTPHYVSLARKYGGKGIEFETNISVDWPRMGLIVAQGEGLFKHIG